MALCIAFDYAEALQMEYMQCGLTIPICLTTDSKQIYDAISRHSVMQEKRLMIRMLLLREGLTDLRIRELLLIPGDQNIADALTKEKDCALWRRVLQKGMLADFSTMTTYFGW